MMELGATVCTPKKPLCVLCPWKSDCISLAKDIIVQLPVSKPRPKPEIWIWKMKISTAKNKIYLEKNGATPFLSAMFFPPSRAKQMNQKPKKFDLKHSVTKYDIYVQLQKIKSKHALKANWFELSDIKKINHSSLMTKILKKIA